jgi:hypothetical protein
MTPVGPARVGPTFHVSHDALGVGHVGCSDLMWGHLEDRMRKTPVTDAFQE